MSRPPWHPESRVAIPIRHRLRYRSELIASLDRCTSRGSRRSEPRFPCWCPAPFLSHEHFGQDEDEELTSQLVQFLEGRSPRFRFRSFRRASATDIHNSNVPL